MGAVIVLVLVYVAVAGVTHIWPFPKSASSSSSRSTTTTTPTSAPPSTQPNGNGNGGVPGSLTALLPKDATGCSTITNVPQGLVGLAATAQCTPSSLGSGASIFAYAFDSQADEQASISARNHDVSFDPTQASSSCPPPTGENDGVATWSNQLYPSSNDQVLECYLAQDSSNSATYPVYVWSIPSRNTFVVAVGAQGSSFNDLDSWWKQNGGPFN